MLMIPLCTSRLPLTEDPPYRIYKTPDWRRQNAQLRILLSFPIGAEGTWYPSMPQKLSGGVGRVMDCHSPRQDNASSNPHVTTDFLVAASGPSLPTCCPEDHPSTRTLEEPVQESRMSSGGQHEPSITGATMSGQGGVPCYW